MKGMSIELTSILILLLFCSILLLALDAIVGGIIAFAFRLSFGKIFRWGLLSLFVPVICILYGFLIERNSFKVKEVELSFTNLPEAFDGYRVVQLSDIHSRSFRGRPDALGRAVDKVNALDADIIAFTGDVITMTPDELDVTGPILASLRAKDGILSILGNHDYGVYAKPGAGQVKAPDCSREVAQREEAIGWDILLDESRIIRRGEDSLAIIGVENTTPSPHFESRGNLAEASDGTDGLFRILLSHDPMHWEMEVKGNGYPLMLAGHTHAAQFSIFGWCPSKWLFKQYRGLYGDMDEYLYVNVGLGETIVPVRVGAKPEITLITLKRNNAASPSSSPYSAD